MAITYLPSRVGSSSGGRRRGAACMPVWRYRVSPKYIQWGTAPSVPMAQASWIATSMYWLARRQAVEQRDGDGVQHKHTAHVPGLIALAANRRDAHIGIPRARHCATQREMRGIVHLQIVPRPILPEVGERGINQAIVPRHRG